MQRCDETKTETTGTLSDAYERTAHILRIDWDGNIAGIYFMDKAITGGFCVDEAAGEMYCISHETEDSDEYYDIVSYKL